MVVRALIFGFITLSIISFSRASTPPDAETLLLNVRKQQATQKGMLSAQLRDKGRSIPFRIVWDAGTIRYEFSNPDQVIFLKMGNKTAQLLERQGNKAAAVIVPSQFDQRVRDTSVTYEDLAFQFLYWPQPIIIKQDNLRTRPSWVLQLRSPGRSSRYATVRIWVDKESGALLRMEGFNFQGLLLKRFEVISAQRVEGRWLLKEMRIEEYDPESGKVIDRAYLTILAN